MHRSFCKTARVRRLGRTGSYELSVGITRPENTDSQYHSLSLSLAFAVSPSLSAFLCISFSVSLPSLQPPSPGEVLQLQAASQQPCTQEVIHLHHLASEWQAGERRRLQKNRLSSLLTGSSLTVRTQPIIPSVLGDNH